MPMSWLAPPNNTHRYCHHPVSTRTAPSALATKVARWAFLKSGTDITQQFASRHFHEPHHQLHDVMASTIIITLP